VRFALHHARPEQQIGAMSCAARRQHCGGEATEAYLPSRSREAEQGNACKQVVIRVRPPLPRELQAVHRYENTVAVDAGERVVTLSENLASLQGASNPAGTASVDNGVARAAPLFLSAHVHVDSVPARSDGWS